MFKSFHSVKLYPNRILRKALYAKFKHTNLAKYVCFRVGMFDLTSLSIDPTASADIVLQSAWLKFMQAWMQKN